LFSFADGGGGVKLANFCGHYNIKIDRYLFICQKENKDKRITIKLTSWRPPQ
jgi:hypothetical protein